MQLNLAFVPAHNQSSAAAWVLLSDRLIIKAHCLPNNTQAAASRCQRMKRSKQTDVEQQQQRCCCHSLCSTCQLQHGRVHAQDVGQCNSTQPEGCSHAGTPAGVSRALN